MSESSNPSTASSSPAACATLLAHAALDSHTTNSTVHGCAPAPSRFDAASAAMVVSVTGSSSVRANASSSHRFTPSPAASSSCSVTSGCRDTAVEKTAQVKLGHSSPRRCAI